MSTLAHYLAKMLVGARILNHRQASLEAGLSENVVNQIINGRVTSPAPETLRKLANRWGTEEDYLNMMRLAGHTAPPADFYNEQEAELLTYYRHLTEEQRRLVRSWLKTLYEDQADLQK